MSQAASKHSIASASDIGCSLIDREVDHALAKPGEDYVKFEADFDPAVASSSGFASFATKGSSASVARPSPHFSVRPDGAYHQWRKVPPR